jgi:hypothetical protein
MEPTEGPAEAEYKFSVVNPAQKTCNIPILSRGLKVDRWGPLGTWGLAVLLISGISRSTRAVLALVAVARASVTVVFGIAAAVFYRGSRQDVYNILWAVVFGFATLNILSLTARRMEPKRRGLTFGEVMAVGVVVISVFLLGWEMLSLMHIFPIQLKR